MKARARTGLVAFATACLLAGVATADHHETETEAHDHGGASAMDAETEAMMNAWIEAGKPGEQHAEMAEAAGVWKAEVRSWMGGPEPIVTNGFADRSMILDGRVLREEFYGEFMGSPFAGFSLTGYDNATEEYWTLWIDSMSTGVMSMRGERNEDGAIVWKGEMTNPMNGEKSPVKSIQHLGEDEEHFEMWEPRGPEGEMVKSMEITYTR